MAQKMTESFITTSRPGAYFEVKVKSTPVGAANSGNIVIIGEATGGASVYGIDNLNGDKLADNYFTPTQLDRVVNKYVSGPIVDAFRALSAPSSDPNITGSANRIFIVKTNTGNKASSLMSSNYGILSDRNFGIDGNKYFYNVTQSKSEVSPKITSDAIIFDAAEEIGSISVDQANMVDGDYYYITSADGVKYAVALDTTGGALNVPTGAKYVGAGYKVVLDVSGVGSDSALATAIINAFNGLTNFTSKIDLFDTDSAVISISQIETGVVVELPNAYSEDDALNGAAVGSCAIGYVSSQAGDDSDGSILNGLEFAVRVSGGLEIAILLSNDESDHDTVAKLALEIDGQLSGGISCSDSGNQLVFELADTGDNNANELGIGRCFELVDSNVGDLLAIGLSPGLVVSSQEPEVQINVNRKDTGVNEEFFVNAEVAMLVGYEGTSATLSISQVKLTTVVVGGTGSNLDINLEDFSTLGDLADFINSQTGYTASVVITSSQRTPQALDKVENIGICSSAEVLSPGRIKRSLYNFDQKVNASASVQFEAIASKGLPRKLTKIIYLTGGEKGSTSAANIVSAMSDLEGIDVNFVVPLFSRDAADDIEDGLTDSSSTYSIDAVNALIKSHVLKMSTPKLKKNRSAVCSFWGTYNQAKSKCGSLSNARLSLCFQRSTQVNSLGNVVSYLPWHTSCIAVGMQAAGFYKAIVNKFANVIAFGDPVGFDSGNPGDIEDALEAGLLFMEKSVIGNKWVSDQTTYGIDTNFVYNSLQAMYTADILSLDLASSFQTAFVGQSLADVNAAVALSFLAAKMDAYKKQKLIAASDDAPLGFKNAKVEISGPLMRVSVEIKLATAIYFIPINIEISQVTSSAE